MNHVMVLVAAHCEPEVLAYTLGTWLEHYDGSYKATVCVSIQTDYDSHCARLADIQAMAPPIEIIRVKPMDFHKHAVPFSRAHARCLRQLFNHCQGRDFTHVAILDHDLEFHQDFIKWAISQESDWVMSLFDDRSELLDIKKACCGKTYWAPKPSIWHTVFSRKLFDKMMEDPRVVLPDCMFGSLVYDTAAKMYELAKVEWDVDIRVFPQGDIANRVSHLWGMSFNYGPTVAGHDDKLVELKQKYGHRFPQGIGRLLAKLSARAGATCI